MSIYDSIIFIVGPHFWHEIYFILAPCTILNEVLCFRKNHELDDIFLNSASCNRCCSRTTKGRTIKVKSIWFWGYVVAFLWNIIFLLFWFDAKMHVYRDIIEKHIDDLCTDSIITITEKLFESEKYHSDIVQNYFYKISNCRYKLVWKVYLNFYNYNKYLCRLTNNMKFHLLVHTTLILLLYF